MESRGDMPMHRGEVGGWFAMRMVEGGYVLPESGVACAHQNTSESALALAAVAAREIFRERIEGLNVDADRVTALLTRDMYALVMQYVLWLGFWGDQYPRGRPCTGCLGGKGGIVSDAVEGVYESAEVYTAAMVVVGKSVLMELERWALEHAGVWRLSDAHVRQMMSMLRAEAVRVFPAVITHCPA